jgi:hypothetical protein
VEGDKTNVEEIDRTAKIKHTQNKQRKKQYREEPKPKSRENKQKQNTMGNKARTGR